MNAVACPTAWSHLPTRRAWGCHVFMNVLGIIGLTACWVAFLAITTYGPSWGVWLSIPYFLYGTYRIAAQLRIILTAFRMLRVLRTYPWRIMVKVPRGLNDRPEVMSSQYGWFEFPNPGRQGHLLPLVFASHLRTRWWAKRMSPCAKSRLKNQIETVWFAGDPRFIGVVAAPARKNAPRRMHVVEQRIGERSGQHFIDWCATPEDIERGRQAGVYPVRPGNPVSEGLS